MSRPGRQPGGGAVPEREADHSASVRVLSLGVALWPGCSPAGGWPGDLGPLPASSPPSPSTDPADDSLGSLELDQRTHFPQFSYSASIRE